MDQRIAFLRSQINDPDPEVRHVAMIELLALLDDSFPWPPEPPENPDEPQ